MGLYLQCIVRFRHLSHMLSHYVQISSSIHARLFGSVRSECISGGAGSLRSIYCLSLGLHASPFLMCARTQQWIQQWIWGVCERRVPWWDCAYAQARLSCRCSHNILVCLISWHVVGTCFRYILWFCAWRRSRFKLDIKGYFTRIKVKKYLKTYMCFVVTCWERADLLASFVVSSLSLSLSHWYPGSGVVLDCIDSWSLHLYLLL